MVLLDKWYYLQIMSFIASLLILILLIFPPVVFVRTFLTMLNSNNDRGHPYLVTDLFIYFFCCATCRISSPTRDRTRVPCIGRQILNHWTTREVPHLVFLLAELGNPTLSLWGSAKDRRTLGFCNSEMAMLTFQKAIFSALWNLKRKRIINQTISS